jgi:hypothetical protein
VFGEAVFGEAVFGDRAWPELHRAHLIDVLLRVGRLADEVPELDELVLGPVVITDRGAQAGAAQARLAASGPLRPEEGLRHL